MKIASQQDDLHEEIMEEVAVDAEDGTGGKGCPGSQWSQQWSPKAGAPEELKEPKLFVTRLPEGTAEAELKDHFEELFGDVKDVAFIYHPETKALRFGFVVFDRLEVAQWGNPNLKLDTLQ